MESSHGNKYRSNQKIVTLYNTGSRSVDPYLQDFSLCDVVVFDLPDAGVRPYTYRSVMTLALRIASVTNTRFILLDTPNPASYLGPSGSVVLPEKFSVLGEEIIPFFPYYTYGELARYYRNKNRLSVKLTIVKMPEYSPGDHFRELPYSYLPPSPNLPHYRSLECYWIGIFLEGIAMDEGRASKDPFCTIGHPQITPGDIPPEMGGVTFEPFSYPGLHGKYKGNLLHGYRIEIEDPEKYRPDEAAYKLIQYLMKKYPQISWIKRYSSGTIALDHLTGSTTLRTSLEAGHSFETWKKRDATERKKFVKEMSCCEIY